LFSRYFLERSIPLTRLVVPIAPVKSVPAQGSGVAPA
jgi:hypothetical protein